MNIFPPSEFLMTLMTYDIRDLWSRESLRCCSVAVKKRGRKMSKKNSIYLL